MDRLKRDLRRYLEGEVRFDQMTRRAYAVDASIYEVEPAGVVCPRSTHDVLNAIQLCAKRNVSIIARGAATGITGGCIGSGVILDTSRHMDKILEVNLEEEWVRVQPGVVQDRLNDALAPDGYRLGPDTSTGNRATIGGMLGNNAAGSRSLRYGKMVDHVLEVELALSCGELLRFGPVTDEEWEKKRLQDDAEGRIYREVYRIREEHSAEIEKRFPKIPRRVSGYNLDELLKPGPLNLCRIICGSEGSLGVATEIKLRIAKRPRETALVVIQVDDLVDGLKHVERLLKFDPLALELIDDQIIKMGRVSPAMKGRLDWLKGEPDALFVMEMEAETPEALQNLVNTVLQQTEAEEIGYVRDVLTAPEAIDNVWALRKSGLGLLLSRRTHAKAIAFVEDITVHPNEVQHTIREFRALLKKHGKEAGIYGHIGSGCIHLRPYIDLKRPEDLATMIALMDEVGDLILKHGGALSGEHGDGFLRSWTNEKMFGPTLYNAFRELKSAFDPPQLMNPGKVVATTKLLDNLRMNPDVKQETIRTQYAFKREGGFAFAVEMCNGNGQCRKKEGTMCPSFQASGDETHTTRARAQMLRAIVNGRLPKEEFTGKAAREILDLCIECKGCKRECPSEIDMAKIKAEFLYHYHAEHGIPVRDRLFAHFGTLSRLTSPFAPVANWIAGSALGKHALTQLGIAPERQFPPFASQRFSSWARRNIKEQGRPRVVLFSDTFTEFQTPHVGISAAQVLDRLGYDVIVPRWTCCGRTLISKGLLIEAKRKAVKLVETLYPLAREGLPIIGLEPSCILTVKDDLRDLGEGPKLRMVVDAAITFDEFIDNHHREHELPFKELYSNIRLHGHCHQKALVGTEPTLRVLNSLPGAQVEEIPSGCCGMAGSFGYEAEHYDFSLKIGELVLFPAVRQAPPDSLIVANGISCRNQILHGTGNTALHLAEALARAL